MGKTIIEAEDDGLQRITHRQNAVCSLRLLAALRHNHSVWVEKFEPDPEPVTVPEPSPAEPLNASDPVVPELVAPVILATNKVERIKRIICRRFNVSKSGLESNSRVAKLVLPRQIGMYVARKYTTQSFPEIGRRFGGRDHTTILYAVGKIERLVASDPAIATQVQEIIAELPA